MRKPIAMLGLDAGDLLYIRSNLDRLPHLRRLFTAGQLHTLGSTAALLTGSVWPSFYTGAHPDVHGIYHNLQWDWHRMRLRRVSDDWLPCAPFWHALETEGFRCVTLDVPMSFAPRLDQGIEIVNWGAHDELGPYACNNSALGRELLRRFGRHPMGGEVPVNKGKRKRTQIQSELIAGIRKKAAAAGWLMATQDWDLFITVFGETHRAGHILWPDPELGVDDGPLLEIYRAVDAAIGDLLQQMPGDTLIVVFALHGMETNRSQEHFVSAVVERVNSASGGPGPGPATTHAQRSLMRWLRDHLPAPVQHLIADAVPAAIRDWVVDRSLAGGRDWSRTPGFPLHADLNGYVRFNIRGRERDGMLDGQDAIRAYRGAVQDAFERMRNPANKAAIVAEVVNAAEVFSGPRATHLPDLIVRWQPAANVLAAEIPELGVFSGRRATGRGGNHRPEGFCVLYQRDSALPDLTPPGHIVDLAGWIGAALRSGPIQKVVNR